MWPKSIVSPPFLIIQFLVIFQISFGKPTTEEEPFSHNTTTTTEPVDITVREDGDVNSSFSETLSVLLTVLSPNDTSAAEEDDSSNSTSPFLNNTANSTTTEPEYYDDQNLTTSSSSTLLLNELESVAEDVDEDDLDMFASSVHLGSSTESSSSSLITDEMEVADSLDESVTATMLTFDEKYMSSGNVDDDATAAENDDGNPSSSSSPAGNSILSIRDVPSSATDDSIIIASMSSNLNFDTVEPLLSSHHQHVINTDADGVPPTKHEIITNSPLLNDGSSSSSPELVEPT